jgi:hypothetical protein
MTKNIILVCFLSFFLKLNAQQNCNDTVNFYVYYQGCPQVWDTLTIYTFTTGGTYTSSELGDSLSGVSYQYTEDPYGLFGSATVWYIFDFYGPWNQYYTFTYNLNGCLYTDSVFIGSALDPFPNTITSQPTSQTINCGSNPNPFSISATGQNDYQWFSSTDGLTFSAITNATSNSYIPPNSQIGTFYYYCQISKYYLDCYTQNSINSDTVSLNSLQSATITSQPLLLQNVCQNSTASPLIVTVDNPNVTYQWYSNTINSNVGGIPISGATSNSYTPPTIIAGTTYYYCIINGCNNISSDVAMVIVNPTPSIISPTNGMFLCSSGGFVQIQTQTNVPSYLEYCVVACSGVSTNSPCPISQQTFGYSNFSNIGINLYNSQVHIAGQGSYAPCVSILDLTPVSQFGCIGNHQYTTISVANQLVMPNINNIEICSGESLNVILNNSDGTTYTWGAQINNNVIGESSSQNTNIINDLLLNTTSVNQLVTYTVTPYSPNNSFCPNTPGQPTSFTVTVKPAPTLNISDATICSGASTQLIGNGTPIGGTYLWSGNGLTSPANQQSQISVSPSITTSYNVSYNQNGCTTNDFVTVTVNQVSFDFHVNISPCGTSSDTIEAYVNIPGGVLSTTELSGNQINDGGQTWWYADQNVPNLEEYVTFTYSLNGCLYSDSVYVDTDRNFIMDEVIDTTIHPCQYFGLFEIPNNDYWDDSELDFNNEYIDYWSSNVNDFVHFTNYPNGYNNTTLIGYSESTNGCLVDTVHINFGTSQYFFADTSGTNWITSCGNNPVQLNGIQLNNADSMIWTSWYNGNLGQFNNVNSLNALYYPVQSDFDQGYVILTLQAFYPHCQFPDTSDLVVSFGANVQTGNDTIICAFSPIELNSTGVNFTIWNSGNVDGDIVILDSGNYQFIVTGYSGYNNFCVSIDTLNVFVNPNPQIDAGQDISICEGETITLNATGISNINWSNGESNNSSFIPLSSQEIIATGIDGNNCSDLDTIMITVNPNPQIDAGQDISICQGDSLTLEGSGAQTLQWSNGIIDGNAFVPVQTETFVLNGIDINGCAGSDSITVSVYPHSDTTITASSVGDFTWSINGQTYSESGVYTAIIPNQNGCDSTITLSLTISSSSLAQLINNEGIDVYPNPNNGMFEIVIGSQYLNSNYEIYSFDGRKVLNGLITEQKEKVVLPASIAEGVYSVRIKNEVLRVVIVQ